MKGVNSGHREPLKELLRSLTDNKDIFKTEVVDLFQGFVATLLFNVNSDKVMVGLLGSVPG